MSGSSTINQVPVYGARGVPSGSNVPGSRARAAGWVDGSGDFWLYGGIGNGSIGVGHLSDLWRWDGANWTWITGNDTIDEPGVFGAKGVADPANVPGGREQPRSWVDANGHFWIFGGSGFDAQGTQARLNGLWRFVP